MAISYKELWKLLIDKDMKEKDLQRVTGISSASVTKLRKIGRCGNMVSDFCSDIYNHHVLSCMANLSNDEVFTPLKKNSYMVFLLLSLPACFHVAVYIAANTQTAFIL